MIVICVTTWLLTFVIMLLHCVVIALSFLDEQSLITVLKTVSVNQMTDILPGRPPRPTPVDHGAGGPEIPLPRPKAGAGKASGAPNDGADVLCDIEDCAVGFDP